METRTRPAPAHPAIQPTEVAKAALRRLVVGKLEPTPENYARAYRVEAGLSAPPSLPERAHTLLERLVTAATPQADTTDRQSLCQAVLDGRWEQAEHALAALAGVEAQGAVLAGLIERIVRGVERGGRQWTSGRRKESLHRVLAGSRTDAQLLQRRLSQLVTSWDSDSLDSISADLDTLPATDTVAPPAAPSAQADAAQPGPEAIPAATAAPDEWPGMLGSLVGSLRAALPSGDANEAGDLAEALASLAAAIRADGASAQQAAALAALCKRADRVLQHRHHFVDQLGGLCRELTASLGDLAEDGSWAKGQMDAMKLALDDGITARGVRSVAELLRQTRLHQADLRDERGRARDALKSLINQMLQELGDLGSQTGRFHDNVGRYADVIDRAESLESLTGVVGEMLEETRTVQALVGQTQQRLQSEHARATVLNDRVAELETELRRLSEEVSTDQLTQIANRRGLMQAFEAVRAAHERDGQPVSIGLLDIDNFKRLNDELGHSAGDEALRTLAGVVGKSLRPGDVVARFGGEEFVVLLPATADEEGQQILTRLQRALSVGLFMHERKTVFVTFSAGVTAYRTGESIERALERADEALYLAKRSGKNRTCIG